MRWSEKKKKTTAWLVPRGGQDHDNRLAIFDILLFHYAALLLALMHLKVSLSSTCAMGQNEGWRFHLTSCASLRSFSIFFRAERCFSSYCDGADDGDDIIADLRKMLFEVAEPLRTTWDNWPFNSDTYRKSYTKFISDGSVS